MSNETGAELVEEWEALVGLIISVGGEEDEETSIWLEKVGALKIKSPGPMEPVYPRDVTQLSTEALGQLYDELGIWHDFYQAETAALRGHMQRAKEALSVTEAFLATKVVKCPVTQRKDEVKSRPEYVQLLAHLLRAKHMHQMASSSLARFGNMVKRLSRHVAMRMPALAGLLSGDSYGPRQSDGEHYDDEETTYGHKPAQPSGFRLPKRPGHQSDHE